MHNFRNLTSGSSSYLGKIVCGDGVDGGGKDDGEAEDEGRSSA